MTDAWTSTDLTALRARMADDREELRLRVGDHHRMRQVCGDAADRAAVVVESDLDGLAEQRDRELLAQVESIIERLDEGTYGTCATCGGTIGRARQEAFPRATACIDCARAAGG